jgi:hypothetical protein
MFHLLVPVLSGARITIKDKQRSRRQDTTRETGLDGEPDRLALCNTSKVFDFSRIYSSYYIEILYRERMVES